ncbi:hypothetical protein [Marinicella meishanensis]|uniref:hypothetical protein n=1 Tax=Marinicella meishanensis TaxID=2873263 RepID=UPI001CBABF39|nr:hypothetical protein [Marinicella sp. NBU2979]
MSKSIAMMALLSFLYSTQSKACSCAHATVSERFDDADYVFSAEIIAAEMVADPNAEYDNSYDTFKIVMGPRGEYRNDSTSLEFLYTDISEASCGVRVTIGARHTFMVKDNGRVYLCGSLVERNEQQAFQQLLLDRKLIEPQ